MSSSQTAIHAVALSMAVNIVLAVIKVTVGIVGHSYALIADGIESVSDVFVSVMVLVGLKVAEKPADQDHPYGHGKAEQLAGLFSALALLLSMVHSARARPRRSGEGKPLSLRLAQGG